MKIIKPLQVNNDLMTFNNIIIIIKTFEPLLSQQWLDAF